MIRPEARPKGQPACSPAEGSPCLKPGRRATPCSPSQCPMMQLAFASAVGRVHAAISGPGLAVLAAIDVEKPLVDLPQARPSPPKVFGQRLSKGGRSQPGQGSSQGRRRKLAATLRNPQGMSSLLMPRGCLPSSSVLMGSVTLQSLRPWRRKRRRRGRQLKRPCHCRNKVAYWKEIQLERGNQRQCCRKGCPSEGSSGKG